MSLLRLKTVPVILIEDDANKNIIPLLQELVSSDTNLNLFCYEQPIAAWKNVFRSPNVNFYEEFDLYSYNKITTKKCTVVIDSMNQMSLTMGWYECLKGTKRLIDNSNVEKLILVLHKDCLTHTSKIQTHLNHMVNAVISYDLKDNSKIWVKIKKGNKVMKSEEILSYDSKTATLKSSIVIKEVKDDDDEPQKPSPASLSTFKIEVDQIDKMEKSKLKLPYMSKIHAGESKIYYEPDAVDDWDEEDPDEDLDI